MLKSEQMRPVEPEIRNPNLEIRNKFKVRNSNVQNLRREDDYKDMRSLRKRGEI